MRFTLKVAGAFALATVIAAGPAMAIDGDTTIARDHDARRPSTRFFGRGDLAYLALSAAAVGIAASNDHWLTHETTESHSAGEARLSSLARPFGSTAVVLPVLGLSYGFERLSHHPEAAGMTMRIGTSVVVAGAAAGVLKEIVGRSRPSESPDNVASFRPFSGRTSFPSGHTAVAFAAAAAADRELSSRWFPWVAYPAAALIGWSRVHDDRHWTSDVVAGAAIGFWAGRKTDDWLRSRGSRVGLGVVPGSRGVGLTVRF